MTSRLRVVMGLVFLVLALSLCAAPAMAATSFERFNGITLPGNGVFADFKYLNENYYRVYDTTVNAAQMDFNLFGLWSPPGADFDLYLFDSAAQLIAWSVSSTLFTDEGNQLDYIGYSYNTLPSGYYHPIPYAYDGSGTYMFAHIWKNNFYFY